MRHGYSWTLLLVLAACYRLLVARKVYERIVRLIAIAGIDAIEHPKQGRPGVGRCGAARAAELLRDFLGHGGWRHHEILPARERRHLRLARALEMDHEIEGIVHR